MPRTRIRINDGQYRRVHGREPFGRRTWSFDIVAEYGEVLDEAFTVEDTWTGARQEVRAYVQTRYGEDPDVWPITIYVLPD